MDTHSAHDYYKKAIAQKEREYEELRGRFLSSESQRTLVMQKLEDVTRRTEDSRVKLEERKKQILAYKGAMEKAQTTVDGLNKQKADLQTKVTKLQGDLEKKDLELATFRATTTDLKLKLSTLEAKFQTHQMTLNSSDAVKELTIELTKLRPENQKLAAKNEKLINEVHELREKLAKAATAVSTSSAAQVPDISHPSGNHHNGDDDDDDLVVMTSPVVTSAAAAAKDDDSDSDSDDELVTTRVKRTIMQHAGVTCHINQRPKHTLIWPAAANGRLLLEKWEVDSHLSKFETACEGCMCVPCDKSGRECQHWKDTSTFPHCMLGQDELSKIIFRVSQTPEACTTHEILLWFLMNIRVWSAEILVDHIEDQSSYVVEEIMSANIPSTCHLLLVDYLKKPHPDMELVRLFEHSMALLKYAMSSTLSKLPAFNSQNICEYDYYPPLSHPDAWKFVFGQPAFQLLDGQLKGKILWIALRALVFFYSCSFTFTNDVTPLIQKKQSFRPHNIIPFAVDHWAYLEIKDSHGNKVTLLDHLTRTFVLEYGLERAREGEGRDFYSNEDERKIIVKLYMVTMFIMAQPRHEAIYDDWEKMLITWKTRVNDNGRHPRLWKMFTSVTKDMIARYDGLMGIFKLSDLAKLQLDSMLLRSMIVKYLGFGAPPAASTSPTSSSSKSQQSRAEKRKAAGSGETSKRSKRD